MSSFFALGHTWMTFSDSKQTLFCSADQRVMLMHMGIAITLVLGLLALLMSPPVVWLLSRSPAEAATSSTDVQPSVDIRSPIVSE